MNDLNQSFLENGTVIEGEISRYGSDYFGPWCLAVTQCARCEDGVSEQPDGAADTLTTEPPVGGDTNTGADGGADQGTMSPDSDDDSAITTAGSVVSEAEDAGSDPQELTTSSPAAAATAQPLTTASAQPAADIQASTGKAYRSCAWWIGRSQGRVKYMM